MKLLLKNLLFTVLIPGTVAVYVPLAIAAEHAPVRGPGLVAAILLLLLGAAIYLWCLWDFAMFGRGTPAPIDAPKRLVVRGLYRHVRNPMYVGVVLVILAWAALFADHHVLFYAASAACAFHLFVILYEERTLLRAFGDEYAAYRLQVPRWIPRPR